MAANALLWNDFIDFSLKKAGAFFVAIKCILYGTFGLLYTVVGQTLTNANILSRRQRQKFNFVWQYYFLCFVVQNQTK